MPLISNIDIEKSCENNDNMYMISILKVHNSNTHDNYGGVKCITSYNNHGVISYSIFGCRLTRHYIQCY